MEEKRGIYSRLIDIVSVCPTLGALRHPAAPDALLDLARALAHSSTGGQFNRLFEFLVQIWQCSNGIRIFAGASAFTGSGAEAELFCTSAELFCTSVVADAPDIVDASGVTGAPFITGSPVVIYIFDRSFCINRRSWLNRSSFLNRSSR